MILKARAAWRRPLRLCRSCHLRIQILFHSKCFDLRTREREGPLKGPRREMPWARLGPPCYLIQSNPKVLLVSSRALLPPNEAPGALLAINYSLLIPVPPRAHP